MTGWANPLCETPPLEGSRPNLVGADMPEPAFSVCSIGGGVSCLGTATGDGITRAGDMTVGALRTWVSEK